MSHKNRLSGWHSVHLFRPRYGDWSFEGATGKVYLKRLKPFLTTSRLEEIEIDEIGWKGMNWSDEDSINCPCCGGIRYTRCDINIPGIVSINAPNPYNKKYRMIDGKHRIRKLKNSGRTKGLFYVFTYEEIKNFLSSDVTYTQN